ncbi:hypothetical protein G0U57_015965, partial [Chelydra serpentina]
MWRLRVENPQAIVNPIQGTYSWDKLCLAYKEAGHVEEYLTIFERLREVHKVPEDKKVPMVIAKLSGKALDVYNKMSVDRHQALKYDEFKKVILQRFQITPEVHRVKFR